MSQKGRAKLRKKKIKKYYLSHPKNRVYLNSSELKASVQVWQG